MINIERISVEHSALTELLTAVGEDREVVSAFLRVKPHHFPKFPWDEDGPLAWLLGSETFGTHCPELGRIKLTRGRYSTLNRLEFEGSLTSILLEGGCHGRSHEIDIDSARDIVSDAVDAAFPPESYVNVFRLDDWEWCEFTYDGTIWSSHFVVDGAQSLIWLFCTRDID